MAGGAAGVAGGGAVMVAPEEKASAGMVPAAGGEGGERAGVLREGLAGEFGAAAFVAAPETAVGEGSRDGATAAPDEAPPGPSRAAGAIGSPRGAGWAELPPMLSGSTPNNDEAPKGGGADGIDGGNSCSERPEGSGRGWA